MKKIYSILFFFCLTAVVWGQELLNQANESYSREDYKKAYEKAYEKADEEAKQIRKKVAINLLEEGWTVEKIAMVLKEDVETVKKWLQQT